MKHKSLKILAIFGVVVVVALGVQFYLSPEQRLRRLGYSADEARGFMESLDQSAIAEILAREYDGDYAELLAEESFSADKFIQYLDALAQNDLNVSQIIALVNHPDYEAGRVYSLAMLEIMQEGNYLSSRRERYFALSHQDASADSPTVVTLVNANRDREFYTETSPAHLADGSLVLVNKYYYLDESYIPDLVTIDAKYGTVGVQIAREAYAAFIAMADAALLADVQLYVTSGYRGYADQAAVYGSWVQSVGEELAPSYAALPGYSEHQTGLALDIFTPGETTDTFANCFAAKWLAEHAAEFGFILRYGENSENLTGYDYEAWHFRYVGVEAAAAITDQQLTLEEYWAIQNAS